MSIFRGCLIAAAAAILICVLAFTAVLGFVLIGTAMGLTDAEERARPVPIRELHISGPTEGPKIALVNVEGMIFGSSTPAQQLSPVAVISAKLDRAQRDPEVKGVVLYVDSGGGGITGSDILHSRIRELQEGPDPKPVVSSILNIGASGAYYAICGSEEIIAHPTSLTGSIGVMMPMFNFSELMDKVGIRDESVLSGEFKDMGSPFTDPPEELKERQREILEGIVQNMHEKFVEKVSESRGLESEKVSELADGRIMTAEEAREAQLIDAIGYEEDAVETLSEMEEMEDPRVVQYRRDVSLGALLTSLIQGRANGMDFLPFIREETPMLPRPMYLWHGYEP